MNKVFFVLALVGFAGLLMAEEKKKTAEQHAFEILKSHKVATVSTIYSEDEDYKGFPYGSVMPYAIDEKGNPIVLISEMATHTSNIEKDARVNFFINVPDPKGDIFNSARISAMGKMVKIPHDKEEKVKKIYLKRFKDNKMVKLIAEFGDFYFYRLEIKDVYYIGGYGDIGWLDMKAFRKAVK